MASFAAETLFQIGPLPVTNAVINTLVVDGIIVSGIVAIRKIRMVPSAFQNLMEVIIDSFYSLTQSISPKNVSRIFPWMMSFFIFIIIANWSGLIPGVGTIGIMESGHGKGEAELVPFLRAATSDINTTLGLALVSLVATHVIAIQVVGVVEYLKRYFSINPIFLFVGILELVGEFTKVISLSFRLFGNIYAGEVVIATIFNLFAFLLPLPFLSLEIIVGLVQALVFSMLTMTFMAILSTPHSEGGEH